MSETPNRAANASLRTADTLVGEGAVVLPSGLNPSIFKQLLNASLSFENDECRATIVAAAKLQAMLRDLGPDWAADTIAAADAPSILLMTPQNASHTLGAVVLAGQLRRRGYSVRIVFDADRTRIAE